MSKLPIIKVPLKNLANGSKVIYEGVEYVKQASKLKDHFCLFNEQNGVCLYLHRNTYVFPPVSEYML